MNDFEIIVKAAREIADNAHRHGDLHIARAFNTFVKKLTKLKQQQADQQLFDTAAKKRREIDDDEIPF